MRGRTRGSARAVRGGFTLVEMLVAVGLVVLILSLFGQVFSIATGSLTRQKGNTENDQRARMLATLLRADVDKRTFRDVVPFNPNTDTSTPLMAQRLPLRQGYFRISENDPSNGSDDVLAFTVNMSQITPRSADTSVLYARGVFLKNDPSVNDVVFLVNSNQPEGDDGQAQINSVGASPAAEVIYFLRGGRLYRRVMLIREQTTGMYDAQPRDPSANPLIVDDYDASDASGSSTASGLFYRDFDYSAWYQPSTGMGSEFGPRFLAIPALSNANPASRTFDFGSGPIPIALSVPHLRFMHSAETAHGRPREYADDYVTSAGGSVTAGRVFLGAFTHEETSHASFTYPGAAQAPATHPLLRTDLTMNLATGAIEEYANGPRKGEDLLLSNVHDFDVEVWDPAAGPGQDGGWGFALFDDNGDGTNDDEGEAGWPGSDDGDWVNLGFFGKGHFGLFRAGSGVVPNDAAWGADGQPGAAGVDDDGVNGPDDSRELYLSTGDDYGNRFDTWYPFSLPGAIQRPPPYRPVSLGRDGMPGQAGVDDDLNGTIDDASEIGWPGTDDEIPLRAIRIRVRYLDVSSDLLREMTLVLSLRD